jgi:hypothetical protein
MGYLLDTNLLSDLRRARPHPAVAAWLAAVPEEEIFTSVVVIGEILQGILLVEPRDPAKAQALRSWLARIEATGQVLPVDRAVIERWAAMRVAHPGKADFEGMLIAATAAAHGLAVATRNTADFAGLGVAVVNPWE